MFIIGTIYVIYNFICNIIKKELNNIVDKINNNVYNLEKKEEIIEKIYLLYLMQNPILYIILKNYDKYVESRKYIVYISEKKIGKEQTKTIIKIIKFVLSYPINRGLFYMYIIINRLKEKRTNNMKNL